MHIYNAVIEVTRRCNMECSHCLRGDAEDLDINLDYVETFLRGIDSIGTMTITGGEPSLVPDIIDKIIDLTIKHNVTVGQFYLATNAKHITMDFIAVLLRMYKEWCDYEEDYAPMVNWSNDGYHEGIDTAELRLLKGLSFVGPKNQTDGQEYTLIGQGRAKDYYSDCRGLDKETFEIDENEITEGNIYLNCKGNIIAGCDWSYEEQDDVDSECFLCSVDDFTIDKVGEYVDNVLEEEFAA
jgi:hypothetical protein